MFARLVGYRHRSRVGKLIARADNEIFKRVLGDEVIDSCAGAYQRVSVDLSFASA